MNVVRLTKRIVPFFVANVRSLFPKQEEFMSAVVATGANTIIGTGTWLNNDIGDSEPLLNSSFQIFPKHRTQFKGGGVMIAVSRSLRESVINIERDVEIVWARVKLACKALIVGTWYRPPGYKEHCCGKLYVSVECITKEYENA